jgi:hypothetical protein
VENYLIRHGIVHEPEPRYPVHDLNPGGGLRADWRLADGRFVEYAGMMSDSDYAARMAKKVRLARESGIDLIVLLPEDIARLAEVLPPGR